MRLSRLVLETESNRVALQFHPQLTVLAGVPAPVRAHLVTEMVGGLTGEREGVHLELTSSASRRITIVRPRDGEHRAEAPDEHLDLTEDYRGSSGRIDVLERYGVRSGPDGCSLVIGGDAASRVTESDVQIARLGSLNQAELWSTANRVQVTEGEFLQLSAELEAADTGAQALADVEQKRTHLDGALATRERIQRSLLGVAALAGIASVVVTLLTTVPVLPFVAVAALALAAALALKAKVDVARRQAEAALSSTGSDSYLGFMVNQVNGLMSDTDHRRRLSAVAADHREAAITWTRLVGNVTVDWALTHQRQIDSASRLRTHLGAMDTLSATAPTIDEHTAAVASLVLGRMTEFRRIGYGAESFPLILDDPFTTLDPSVRLGLLELLAREAGSPQVIILTDLPDVADWARLEALGGRAALLEPLGSSSPSEPADPPGRSVSPARPTTSVESTSAEVAGQADGYGMEARGLAV